MFSAKGTPAPEADTKQTPQSQLRPSDLRQLGRDFSLTPCQIGDVTRRTWAPSFVIIVR